MQKTQREINDAIIDEVLITGTANIAPADLKIIKGVAVEYVRDIFRRLREHGYAQTLGLEHAADDRRAEAWVVNIGVAADDERIVPPPAALVHLLGGDGQKITPIHASPSCE